MFQTKFEIELRCRECASVLTLSTDIYTDRGTSFVYVEPCPKCSAQQPLALDGAKSRGWDEEAVRRACEKTWAKLDPPRK